MIFEINWSKICTVCKCHEKPILNLILILLDVCHDISDRDSYWCLWHRKDTEYVLIEINDVLMQWHHVHAVQKVMLELCGYMSNHSMFSFSCIWYFLHLGISFVYWLVIIIAIQPTDIYLWNRTDDLYASLGEKWHWDRGSSWNISPFFAIHCKWWFYMMLI